jgi:hypothetical protein
MSVLALARGLGRVHSCRSQFQGIDEESPRIAEDFRILECSSIAFQIIFGILRSYPAWKASGYFRYPEITVLDPMLGATLGTAGG